MTQGKIERWHQTLKNPILLENYYLPGDLENQIATFVADYNNCRYHESINNLTPADVYFGRGQTILLRIKHALWRDLKLPDGRDRVVRHGHGPHRAIQTGVGPVEVRRAKVRDRGDVGAEEKISRFRST